MPPRRIGLVDGKNTLFFAFVIDDHDEVQRANPLDEENELLYCILAKDDLLDHDAAVEQRLELSEPEVDRAQLVEDVLRDQDRVSEHLRAVAFSHTLESTSTLRHRTCDRTGDGTRHAAFDQDQRGCCATDNGFAECMRELANRLFAFEGWRLAGG